VEDCTSISTSQECRTKEKINLIEIKKQT
jgi:hypothetical protein